jgi:SAM-dependent methyltransferase
MGSSATMTIASPETSLSMSGWETTGCPLCGSRRRSTIGETCCTTSPPGPSAAVVRCRDCDLCYTNPRPTAEAIGRYYTPDYSPHQAPSPSRRRRRGRRRQGNERRWLAKFGRCRLLDFGCGSGTFLRRMHDQGWEVLGLDVSPTAVRCVEHELGLPARLGTLPHADLACESFEVVTMWQSLEHVHAPLEVLEEAHRLLVPGGRLIVSVPNIASGPFRWFGACWYGLDLPRHLTHFSPSTLEGMVSKAGFQTAGLRFKRHNSWLRRSAQKALSRNATSWRHRGLTCRPLARLVGRYCQMTRQSDCIVLTAVKPASGR